MLPMMLVSSPNTTDYGVNRRLISPPIIKPALIFIVPGNPVSRMLIPEHKFHQRCSSVTLGVFLRQRSTKGVSRIRIVGIRRTKILNKQGTRSTI